MREQGVTESGVGPGSLAVEERRANVRKQSGTGC